MNYADEYAAALEPVRYAKKPVTADDYGHYGEGSEVHFAVQRMASGLDPHATSDVRHIAKHIVEDKRWDHLPVLADALEETDHPAAKLFDFRNADDAILRLKEYGPSGSQIGVGGVMVSRQKEIGDALRRLGRHDEAESVEGAKTPIIKSGRRFMPLVHPRDFDPMTRQYAETALWSSHDSPNDDEIENLDENHSIHDLDAETSSSMAEDVKHFRNTLPEHLREVVDGDPEQAGHDLWLSRNGHGAGFNDGDWGEHGEALHDHATDLFGEHNLYIDRQQDDVTDDGRPTFVSNIRTGANWIKPRNRWFRSPKPYKPGHDSDLPF